MKVCIAFYNTQGITTSVNSFINKKTKKCNFIYLSECILSPKQKAPLINVFYLVHRIDQLSKNENRNRNTFLIYAKIENQQKNLNKR